MWLRRFFQRSIRRVLGMALRSLTNRALRGNLTKRQSSRAGCRPVANSDRDAMTAYARDREALRMDPQAWK